MKETIAKKNMRKLKLEGSKLNNTIQVSSSGITLKSIKLTVTISLHLLSL